MDGTIAAGCTADPKNGVLLGVDGGGTKTRFSIADRDGHELFSALVGPTSPKAVPPEQARENMRAGAAELAAAGADLGAVEAAAYGLGGLDLPEERTFFAQMVADAGLPAEGPHALIVNDGLLPLYAAGESRGTVLIAGTGSIAFHVGEAGRVTRVGGWGYGLSDLGSGNWVGAEAIRYALLALDGAVNPDPLVDDVVAGLGLERLDDLARWVAGEHDESSVASLARPVIEGPSPAARRIRDMAAEHLSSLYRGIASKCPEAANEPVVCAGGLFGNDAFFDIASVRLTRVAARIAGSSPHVQRTGNPPVAGAVAIAGALLAENMVPPMEYPPRPA